MKKSKGITKTERLLAEFCERSFLKLWSYPNPFKSDGHELCDLIAIFENQVFIFFDREMVLSTASDKDPDVLWNRWKRNAVDAQLKTALGAERYVRNGGQVFLDGKRTMPFPMPINHNDVTVFKIVVAHGAKEACEQASKDNVSGSLAISYSNGSADVPFPFFIDLEKDNPVHVFDSNTLPILLSELDTVWDFATYLETKEAAIAKLDCLMYCGEEDLLAHYLANYDVGTKRHTIGISNEEYNSLFIWEGEWEDFIQREEYKATKQANSISYFWDDVIQRTCQNSLEGELLGDDILGGSSAIHEMAKEPRFVRRALSERIRSAVRDFPQSPEPFMRNLSFMPSFHSGKAYVFLQIKVPKALREESSYREMRQQVLLTACGSAKNRFRDLSTIVGIAIDAPRYSDDTAEDFVLLDCAHWSDERAREFESANSEFGFFKTGKAERQTIYEFVDSTEL